MIDARYFILQYIPHVACDHQLHAMTMFNDNKSCSLYQDDLVRCYAVVAPENAIVLRVNNTLSLYVINLKVNNIFRSYLEINKNVTIFLFSFLIFG